MALQAFPFSAPRRAAVRRPRRFALAALVIAGLAACDISVKDGNISAEILTGEATSDWVREYPLAPGGHVEIVNANGEIEVTASGADTVNVHAAITAKAFTEKHAKVVLDRGRIEESVTSDRIRVTSVPPRPAHGQSYVVRYEVKVPAHAQVEITTGNGSLMVRGVGGGLKAVASNGEIEVHDVSAPIDASAINGEVTATLSKVGGNIRLETSNGRVSLQMPTSTRASISARTVNGSIAISGLPIEVPEGRRQRRVDTLLNGGGVEIELRTNNGRIALTGTP